MYLYVYEGYQGGSGGRERSEALMRRAAELYIKEERMNLGTVSGQIFRTRRGKPYFKEVPIEFSVSHTGNLWVCLMDLEPVGVDVQEIRECRSDKIAERYYTQDEQAYALAMGESGFFQIWTRKEAYAKYTGTGLSQEMKRFSTLRDDSAAFIDFDISGGVRGSCCMREKRELWIRTIV